MISILLVTTEKGAFSEFTRALISRNSGEITWADSGSAALSLVPEKPFDLVIADERLPDMTGLVFVEKLVKKTPLVNCALVSALSKEAFHEASEGLGLLGQLPPRPGESDARDLMERLRMINRMVSTETGAGEGRLGI
jgi:YesN/AraC family two-component response regulator